MSYDYEQTSVDLYRAVFKDNYSVDVTCYLRLDKELAEAKQIAPILHRTFEDATPVPGLKKRPPDIISNAKTGMYEPDTGGTSVFDRPGVLRRADGDFFSAGGNGHSS